MSSPDRRIPEPTNLVTMAPSSKELPCAKCGRTVLAGAHTVMIFCSECSDGMGVKR